MEQVYQCVVCGHTLTVEEYNSMSEDYTCPDCGVGKSDYELVTV